MAEGLGGQLSSGGLLGAVGDASSREGVNRAERGDKGPLDGEAVKGTAGGGGNSGKGWGESLSDGLAGGGGGK